MPAYFLLSSPFPDPGALTVFEDPPSVRSQSWKLSSGRPMSDGWEEGVRYRGDREGGAQPRDLVANALQILIASTRLKALLDAETATDMEWLPIELETPRGRLVSEPYHILNPLSFCDALDSERSEVEDLSIIPGQYSGLFRMHLRRDAAPSDLRLFRLKSMPSATVVREDLKTEMLAAGLTGLKFIAEGQSCSVY